MDSVHRKVIQRCTNFLLENIYDVGVILNYFVSAELITVTTKEEIESHTTRYRRKETLLGQLTTWGEQAFSVFCAALKDSKHEHVVAKLQTELQNVLLQTAKDATAIDGITSLHSSTSLQACAWLSPEDLNRQVTEKELTMISRELAPAQLFWLGQMLGMSQGKLEQCQASAPYSVPLQISKMLIEWKNSVGSQATVGTFIRHLRTARVDEGVYKNIILEHSKDTGFSPAGGQNAIIFDESLKTISLPPPLVPRRQEFPLPGLSQNQDVQYSNPECIDERTVSEELCTDPVQCTDTKVYEQWV